MVLVVKNANSTNCFGFKNVLPFYNLLALKVASVLRIYVLVKRQYSCALGTDDIFVKAGWLVGLADEK